MDKSNMKQIIPICVFLLGCTSTAYTSLLPVTLPPIIPTLIPLPTWPPPVDPAKHNLSTPEMAKRDGYPVESHYITTPDGYILNAFRIPSSPQNGGSSASKPVVYLQHGLLASSATWLTNAPGSRLAYILADNGYDVWLGNARGTLYSRNHTTLDPNTDPKFWDFSYHQSGVYDLPATIDYILDTTNQQNLSYIGHSMGTTMFFVMTSELPEYNSKINGMIALAPVANTTFLTSPIRLIAPAILLNLTAELVANLSTSGTGEYSPNSATQQQFKMYTCINDITTYALCSIPNYVVMGFDFAQTNTNISADLVGHYPQGTSVYSVMHLAQGINSHRFAQYDYGSPWANQQAYGAITPPAYNVTNINTPISLMWGANDWLADPTDVASLYKAIKGTVKNFIRVNYDAWNHADFVSGKDANLYVNTPVLNILAGYIS